MHRTPSKSLNKNLDRDLPCDAVQTIPHQLAIHILAPDIHELIDQKVYTSYGLRQNTRRGPGRYAYVSECLNQQSFELSGSGSEFLKQHFTIGVLSFLCELIAFVGFTLQSANRAQPMSTQTLQRLHLSV